MGKLRQIHIELVNGTLTYTDEQGKLAKDKHAYILDHDGFQWCSNSGGLEVHFNKDGSPFANDPTRTVNIGCSKPPLVPNKVGAFDYKVTLTDGAGTPHGDDPRVTIDPGTALTFNALLTLVLLVLLGGTVVLFGLRKLQLRNR